MRQQLDSTVGDGEARGAAVAVKGLSFSYGTTALVLESVSFSLQEGEIAALVGPSGCGKTTLLYCIQGIIPHLISGNMAGKVQVFGTDTRSASLSTLAEDVQTVFQIPGAQLFAASVDDEVAFGLENFGFAAAEAETRLTWALGLLSANHLRDRDPQTLSLGEKQRVALAAAIAIRPKVVLLDEPTANLDPATSIELCTTIKDLANSGLTVILAEHDLPFVRDVAARVLVMDRGRLIRDGSTVDILRSDALEQAGMIPPEPIRVFKALQSRGLRVPQIPTRVSEAKELLLEHLPDREQVPQTQLSALEPDHEIVLDANDITVRYPKSGMALDRATASFPAGRITAVVGRNGAGKTTLGRALAGLVVPDRGEVTLRGRTMHEIPARERAVLIALVLQNPLRQLFADTALEEVEFKAKCLGKDDSKILAQDALEMVGLLEYAHEHPTNLSVGQQRRLTIASHLVVRPEILILDEPTTGLDTASARKLLEYALGAIDTSSATIILTHDMSAVSEYADTVFVMAEGRVIARGAVREVFASEKIRSLSGIRPSPEVLLASALERQGVPRSVQTAADLEESIAGLLREAGHELL